MSREPCFLKVEIGGDVVRREAEPLHLYNEAGHLVATCMRPKLRNGEMLVERLGQIHKIIEVQA